MYPTLRYGRSHKIYWKEIKASSRAVLNILTITMSRNGTWLMVKTIYIKLLLKFLKYNSLLKAAYFISFLFLKKKFK